MLSFSNIYNKEISSEITQGLKGKNVTLYEGIGLFTGLLNITTITQSFTVYDWINIILTCFYFIITYIINEFINKIFVLIHKCLDIINFIDKYYLHIAIIIILLYLNPTLGNIINTIYEYLSVIPLDVISCFADNISRLLFWYSIIYNIYKEMKTYNIHLYNPYIEENPTVFMYFCYYLNVFITYVEKMLITNKLDWIKNVCYNIMYYLTIFNYYFLLYKFMTSDLSYIELLYCFIFLYSLISIIRLVMKHNSRSLNATEKCMYYTNIIILIITMYCTYSPFIKVLWVLFNFVKYTGKGKGKANPDEIDPTSSPDNDSPSPNPNNNDPDFIVNTSNNRIDNEDREYNNDDNESEFETYNPIDYIDHDINAPGPSNWNDTQAMVNNDYKMELKFILNDNESNLSNNQDNSIQINNDNTTNISRPKKKIRSEQSKINNRLAQRERWANKTEEEKNKTRQYALDIYHTLSREKKDKYNQNAKLRRSKWTAEQKASMNAYLKEYHKKIKSNMSNEQLAESKKIQRERVRVWRAKRTPEQRALYNEKQKKARLIKKNKTSVILVHKRKRDSDSDSSVKKRKKDDNSRK